MTEQQTMEIPDVAKRLGITTREVLELLDTDQLPRARNDSNAVVVPADAVEQYAAAHGT